MSELTAFPLQWPAAAYKKKAKLHHPNSGGDPVKWRELQEAYEQGLKHTT